MKNIRRILGILLALCLVLALPVQVLAAEYNIGEGDVVITAKEDGQNVNHGGEDKGNDPDPVVTGSSTEHTVTIKSEDNATANVTFDNVSIDVSSPKEAAISVQGNASITLEGKNEVSSGSDRAGVEVNSGSSVTISGGEGASLEATGGSFAAGIGGGDKGDGGTITINGGEVTATGGGSAAGIGGGWSGNGGSVTINGGEVTATGGIQAAGIGGGCSGNGGSVTINGGSVEATGGEGGAGIGGGFGFDLGGSGGNVTINGGTVNAKAGASYDPVDPGADPVVPGADIGGGGGETLGNGGTITITGGTVNGVNYDAPPAEASQEEEDEGGSRDNFWDTIGWQVSTAQEGSTFSIDAAHRTLIPSYVVKNARSRNVTLVITWDGGGDITIAPDAEVDLSQWCVYLKDL